jgi:hydrogenase expression/formation protein HypD
VRAVRREGVPLAQRQVFEVFEIGERKWRGVGEIPRSGYRLRDAYARFDAELRFDVGLIRTNEHPACIAGAILTGEKLPTDCLAYGTLCSPQKPLGAPMVSSEGTCAAFFSAGRGLGATRSPLPVTPLVQVGAIGGAEATG